MALQLVAALQLVVALQLVAHGLLNHVISRRMSEILELRELNGVKHEDYRSSMPIAQPTAIQRRICLKVPFH